MTRTRPSVDAPNATMRTSVPPGPGPRSNCTTSIGWRVAAESNTRMRAMSGPPREKKCGSTGREATAVTWTSTEEIGDGEEDGEGDAADGEGADDGEEVATSSDGDADTVGVRARGRHALGSAASTMSITSDAARRCTIRLYRRVLARLLAHLALRVEPAVGILLEDELASGAVELVVRSEE